MGTTKRQRSTATCARTGKYVQIDADIVTGYAEGIRAPVLRKALRIYECSGSENCGLTDQDGLPVCCGDARLTVLS
ncbi:MAG TPA: hypothetical protein VFD58_01225 [Blastocatellia bacterium]|nr:hypothetical protein [Blastocatellia bacterium]